MAVVTSLVMTGPGRISVDRLLRVRMPWQLTAVTGLGVVGGVALGLYNSRKHHPEPAAEPEADSA